MEPTVIWAGVTTVISGLASGIAFMFKLQMKTMQGTIDYERECRTKEADYVKEISSDTLTTMNELVSAVGAIPPVVNQDGGRTRSELSNKVKASAQEVISHIQGHT